MIARKEANTRPCSTCANNAGGTKCTEYTSEITGSDADIRDARKECGGKFWLERTNINAMTAMQTPGDAYAVDANGNRYFADRIVTKDGTVVHKEPPAKLYE